MVEGGITEMTLEEELDEISSEEPLVAGGPGTVTDPNDPNYDPNKDPNYDPNSDPNTPQGQKAEADAEKQRQHELRLAKEKKKPAPGKKPPAKK
jgi:predicted RNA-binding protein with PUA-like domain